MEYRFKSYDKGKPKIYKFYDPTLEENVQQIKQLLRENKTPTYIVNELPVSHVLVRSVLGGDYGSI